MKIFVPITALLLSATAAFGAERDIMIENPRAGVSLGATLATPDGTSPRAVLVLVTGSGPQNRDEELFGLKPFKVLSDSLVANGYAVLRMDDRGVGQSTGDYTRALTDDFADDARAGVDYVRDEFETIPVGVLGHSAGGTVAVKLAVADVPDFIVTIGAPAWPGDSIVMAQCRAAASVAGGHWEGEATQRRILDIAKSPMPDITARPAIFQVLANSVGKEMAAVPAVGQQLKEAAAAVTGPWYRDFLRYNPTDDIRLVRVPWLAINGAKDTQVPVDNLTTIHNLNPSATTLPIAGHNHILQHCTTGSVAEYATSGQAPSAEALRSIIGALDALLTPISDRKHTGQ